jgi:hypothetical protein
LGGHATAGVSGVEEFRNQIQAGQLRALAVSGDTRITGLDVPTFKEAGIAEAMTNWRGDWPAEALVAGSLLVQLARLTGPLPDRRRDRLYEAADQADPRHRQPRLHPAVVRDAFRVSTEERSGPFLRWQAPIARSVLVIDGEMPAATLQERLQRIAEGSGRLLPQDLRILASDLHPDGLHDLSDPDGQRLYDEVLGDAKLIIVDNLSTLCRSGRENEAESWLTVQGWALARRREGRAVLFVHHAGKGGGQRGSSRKEDVLNTVIALKRPDDYSPAEGARFEVHFEKTRGFCGPDAEPFEALLTGAGWSMRDLKEAPGDRVIALHRDGLSQREIATEIGTSASAVNNILKRAGGEPL